MWQHHIYEPFFAIQLAHAVSHTRTQHVSLTENPKLELHYTSLLAKWAVAPENAELPLMKWMENRGALPTPLLLFGSPYYYI